VIYNKLVEQLIIRYDQYGDKPAFVFNNTKISYKQFITDVCRGISYLENKKLTRCEIAYFSDFGDYDQIVNLITIALVSRKIANYFWNKPLEAILNDVRQEND
jgi:hypothetical protein